MMNALLAGFVTVTEKNYIDVAELTIDVEVGESIRFYSIGNFIGTEITALFTPPGIGSESGLKFYDLTNEVEEEVFSDSSIKTLAEAEEAYKRFIESADFKAYLPNYYTRRREIEEK